MKKDLLGLPTTLPGGVRGVCIPVPDDDDYVALLRQHLWRLAQWTSYERDHDKTGTLVARLWALALFETVDCEGATMGVTIRQRVGQPCMVDELVAGEWVNVVNLAACVNATLDPGSDTLGSVDAATQAAADLVYAMQRTVSDMIDALQAGAGVDAITQAGNACLPSGYHGAGATSVRSLAEQLTAFGGAASQTAYNGAGWGDLYDYANERYTVGGWLNEAANDIFAWLDNSSSWLFNALGMVASELGLGGINAWAYRVHQLGAQLADGLEDLRTGTWVATYDFTASPGGWKPIEADYGGGVVEPWGAYVEGYGWQNVVLQSGNPGTSSTRLLRIRTRLPMPIDIISISAWLSSDYIADTNTDLWYYALGSSSLNVLWSNEVWPQTPPYKKTWSAGLSDGIGLMLNVRTPYYVYNDPRLFTRIHTVNRVEVTYAGLPILDNSVAL